MRKALALVGTALAIALGARAAGRFLIVDSPVRSDAIVVLNGDVNDARLHRGIQLLKSGFGDILLIDARTDMIEFGQTEAALESGFLSRSRELPRGRRIQVCGISGDSTDAESRSVARCLEACGASTALLVTSDFHTRRALSIFNKRLPRYRWSVAAARDEAIFGPAWWRRREWAKTFFLEILKTIWWQGIDRWRP